MTKPDYARDPDVLAWARTQILLVTERLRTFAETADPDAARQWNAIAAMIEVEVIGTGGPLIGVFDARRPMIEASLTDPVLA